MIYIILRRDPSYYEPFVHSIKTSSLIIVWMQHSYYEALSSYYELISFYFYHCSISYEKGGEDNISGVPAVLRLLDRKSVILVPIPLHSVYRFAYRFFLEFDKWDPRPGCPQFELSRYLNSALHAYRIVKQKPPWFDLSWRLGCESSILYQVSGGRGRSATSNVLPVSAFVKGKLPSPSHINSSPARIVSRRSCIASDIYLWDPFCSHSLCAMKRGSAVVPLHFEFVRLRPLFALTDTRNPTLRRARMVRG
jgi:hypothetical protein